MVHYIKSALLLLLLSIWHLEKLRAGEEFHNLRFLYNLKKQYSIWTIKSHLRHPLQKWRTAKQVLDNRISNAALSLLLTGGKFIRITNKNFPLIDLRQSPPPYASYEQPYTPSDANTSTYVTTASSGMKSTSHSGTGPSPNVTGSGPVPMSTERETVTIHVSDCLLRFPKS